MEALEIRQTGDESIAKRGFKRKVPFSLISSIGNTPLIQIRQMTRHLRVVQILAKAEWFNPGGPAKDRVGLRIIEKGETSGQLTRNKIILDCASGNTGIAYAMIGAIKGYRVEEKMKRLSVVQHSAKPSPP